jgi:hypothetical protein
MKRCTCLSALLVGLTVTTASVAFADEPGTTPVRKVAQAQQQPADPPAPAPDAPTAPEPAPAPDAAPAPAPAPAPAEVEAPQPAITIGGSTSTSDKPSESPAEPTAKKKPRPWANSSIYSVVSMTTPTIFKGQQQYNDPTVDSSIWFLPRYSINDAWQVRGRLIFNYEFTNSDTTVTNNEPRFSDTSLQLVYKKIPAVAGIKPQVFVQAAAPTSPESRARTLIFSPGAGFILSRSFEHIPGDGELDLVANMAYSHPIYQGTNPTVRGTRPYALQCAGGTTCSDVLSGSMNPSDIIIYAGTISATWGKFTPALFYLGSSQWVYHPADAQVPIAGGQTVSASAPADFSRSSVRQTSYFSAWLDYEVNSWLTPEIGYSLSRTILTEDAQYGNPFWDRYQDTRVFLGANVNVDALIDKMAGGATDQSGILRAKNKTPVLHY